MSKIAASLPARYQKLVSYIKRNGAYKKMIFIATGLAATIWFLVRVIPKPGRAAYPCMQTAAPLMSAFVLWLLGLGGGLLSIRKFFTAFRGAKYTMALFFLLLSVSLFFAVNFYEPRSGYAQNKSMYPFLRGEFPPNEPIGQATGIFPGRVVWTYEPGATNINCTNTSNENGVIDAADDAWFMEHNNNPALIDSMISKSLISLSGASNSSDAWDVLFSYFNSKSGKAYSGYKQGEKIFIKINVTSANGPPGNRYYDDLSRNDKQDINEFAAETNPYVVLAVLRQLVEEAGIEQNMIYLGDPARNIYKEQHELWYSHFPNVNYLGNNLIHTGLNIEALGRTPVEVSEEKLVFWSDNGTVMPDAIDDELFSIFEETDYVINIPTLKAHSTAGITLAAKNHFGSFTRTWAMHLHPGLFDGVDDPQRLGYGLYRVQTDIMMHNLLSGKNLLILVDGLYPGEDALGVPEKWQSIPFNNNWCSSIFASLDPVAIESVCHDFLRTEYNGTTIAESRPNWDGVDDYLHQAADSAYWPEGITYDPDNNAELIASLGVHEHWNDSLNKEYTRNLGTGEGIELVKVHELAVSISETNENNGSHIKYYPNPVSDFLIIENSSKGSLLYIYNMNGMLVFSKKLSSTKEKISLTYLIPGVYNVYLKEGNQQFGFKIVKYGNYQ